MNMMIVGCLLVYFTGFFITLFFSAWMKNDYGHNWSPAIVSGLWILVIPFYVLIILVNRDKK